MGRLERAESEGAAVRERERFPCFLAFSVKVLVRPPSPEVGEVGRLERAGRRGQQSGVRERFPCGLCRLRLLLCVPDRFFPVRLLEPLDDRLDVLGVILVAYQHGVRCLNYDDVVESYYCYQAILRPQV